jgi:ABC-type sugar transport system substrate-binding protein
VSPDYVRAGEYTAERALTLFGDAGVRCLELKTDYNGFIMQLLSDGFANKLADNDKMSVVSEQYCGDDEEQAYLLTKAELLSGEKNIGFIFAQSASLARGALRAIQETGSSAKLAAFSGEMDLISSVSSGDMDSAIFIGPKELADIAVDNAGQLLSSPSFVPDSFIRLYVNGWGKPHRLKVSYRVPSTFK